VNVQAFIFNWKGHHSRAAALERQVAELAPVRVINSEEGVRDRYPHWVHLDDSAYFAAQWQRALALFSADVFFHVQADARCDRFDHLFAGARAAFRRHPVGIYEPNIDFVYYRYDTARLHPLEPGLFEVPLTDCTCWFIEGGVLRSAPGVDPAVNRYGWGVAPTVAAVARRQRRLVLRDYRVTVWHPRGRGYSSEAARRDQAAHLRWLRPELGQEVTALYRRYAELKPAEQSSA
jgi:hypothetical protein